MIAPLSPQRAQRTILRWAVIVALVLWPLLLPAALPALCGPRGAQLQRVTIIVTTYECGTMRACADCHSNATVWPWYTNVAPASWLIAAVRPPLPPLLTNSAVAAASSLGSGASGEKIEQEGQILG